MQTAGMQSPTLNPWCERPWRHARCLPFLSIPGGSIGICLDFGEDVCSGRLHLISVDRPPGNLTCVDDSPKRHRVAVTDSSERAVNYGTPHPF